MIKERKDFALEIKSISDSGSITGYAAVFGNVDSYNDIIIPGAFGGGMSEMLAEGRSMAMLWQHDQSEPIGVWDVVREDTAGLYVEGRLCMGGMVPNADKAYALAKMGALGGLSIGFSTQDHEYDGDIRKILKAKVYETSLVTMPANPAAKILSVKGDKPLMLRQFEHLLAREAGLSRSEIAVVINHGFKALLNERDAVGDEAKQLEDIARKVRNLLINQKV